jgi:hypothetical protein
MTSGNSCPARATGPGSAGRKPSALRRFTARRGRRRLLIHRGHVLRVLRGLMRREICGSSAVPASTQAAHLERSTICGCSPPTAGYGRGFKGRTASIRPATTARRATRPPATLPGHEVSELGGLISMATSGCSAAAVPPPPLPRRVISTTCGNIFLEPVALSSDASTSLTERCDSKRADRFLTFSSPHSPDRGDHTCRQKRQTGPQ